MKTLHLIYVCLLVSFVSQAQIFVPGGTVNPSSNGNVGIGTADPVAKLHVNGSFSFLSGAERLLWESKHLGVTDHRNYLAPRLADDSGWDWGQEFGYHHYNRAWYFNDNVGIGTANPNARLDVVGNGIRSDRFSMGGINDRVNDSPWYGMGITDNFTELSIGNQVNAVQIAGFYGLLLKTASGEVAIHENGNVGIGTTTPQDRLQVGEGITKVALGEASGEDMNWGTAYIGLNAVRKPNNEWQLDSDNANNGGSVIYSEVGGSINFVTIPTTSPNGTGGQQQLFTDQDIISNITMKIGANGKVGIGTVNLPSNDPTTNGQQYQLYVKGGIKTQEVKVELCTNWCDYVFEEDYALLSLPQVENHIKTKGHLHNTKSAAEIEAEGLELKSMTINQQEKIEEIFLHLIEMDKQVKNLSAKIQQLEQENAALKAGK